MASDKSGGSNGQQRNVGKGIQVFNRMPIAYPKPFLGSSLESGIVPFTFRSERKSGFEFQRISLNGKPVVVWNCHIFCAAGGLTFLVKALMCAGTIVQMGGSFIGTTIFLSGFSVLCKFSVPMHGKTCSADRCAAWQSGRFFRISLVERNDTLSVVKFPNSVIDCLDIIGLIANERAFLYRQIAVGSFQDVQRHSRICYISGGGQFTKRKPGDAVHQHMVFIAPIKLILTFIVLIGSGVDAEGAVWVAFWVVFLGELVFCKGFGVVLFSVFRDKRGIQSDKGCIQDAQLIQLLDLCLHDFLKNAVIQFPQKAVICPVRGKLFCDVEAAVVSNETIVLQIIFQIGDVAEAFALHDHKCADHGRYRVTGAAWLLLLALQFGQVKMKK